MNGNIETSSNLNAKHSQLSAIISRCGAEGGGLAIAFSGGTDSSLLLAVARAALGDKVLALTATSPLYAEHELEQAVALAGQLGVRHRLIGSNELDLSGFADNPPDRCYLCKRELFEILGRVARAEGITRLADGTNVDDLSDYRPGRRAAREAGVVSPLLEAGLNKSDVRALSRRLDLPTADKPAMACLASRFPYGTPITLKSLQAVGAVEEVLRRNGIRCYRARFHDSICRLEIGAEEMASFPGSAACAAAVKAARDAGFTYVTLDLEGYRTGSLNTNATVNKCHEIV